MAVINFSLNVALQGPDFQVLYTVILVWDLCFSSHSKHYTIWGPVLVFTFYTPHGNLY